MMKPIIITNFKTYKQAIGKRALYLAQIHNTLARLFKAKIMIAVQAADIHEIAHKVTIPVLAQHVDYEKSGTFTGRILPEDVKANGAHGTLLNHAEKRLPITILHKTIKRCTAIGLQTIVCAESVAKARKISKFKPDYIAFEYPPLIATGRSISRVKPDEVRRFAQLISRTQSVPLCGAGVSSGKDVSLALKLGTKGVLLASAVVQSKNPRKILKELITGA